MPRAFPLLALLLAVARSAAHLEYAAHHALTRAGRTGYHTTAPPPFWLV